MVGSRHCTHKSCLVGYVPNYLESRIEQVIIERDLILELVVHADTGLIAQVPEVANVKRTDVLARNRVMIKPVITRIDFALLRYAEAGKNRSSRRVITGPESWREFRLKRKQRGRHVPTDEFGTHSEPFPGPLDIRTKEIFPVVSPHAIG